MCLEIACIYIYTSAVFRDRLYIYIYTSAVFRDRLYIYMYTFDVFRDCLYMCIHLLCLEIACIYICIHLLCLEIAKLKVELEEEYKSRLEANEHERLEMQKTFEEKLKEAQAQGVSIASVLVN